MGAEPIARAWWWLVAVSTLMLVGVTVSRAHLPMDAVDAPERPEPLADAPSTDPPAPPSTTVADESSSNDEAVPDEPGPVGVVEVGADDPIADGSGAPPVLADIASDEGAAEDVAPPPAREGTTDEPCAFRLNRAMVARNVEHREPVDPGGPFPADGTALFVFIDADNRGDNASDYATVRWIHRATGGVWSNRARLGRNHRWRTWVDRALPATRVGAWQAQIIDDEGCLLQTLDFEVIPHGW